MIEFKPDIEQTDEISETTPKPVSTDNNSFLKTTGLGLLIQFIFFAATYAYIWMYPRWAQTGLGGYTNENLPAAFTVLITITTLLLILIIVLPILKKGAFAPGLVAGSFVVTTIGVIFFIFVFYFSATTYDVTGSANLPPINPFPFLKFFRLLLTGGF